jgi:hypothetical protein
MEPDGPESGRAYSTRDLVLGVVFVVGVVIGAIVLILWLTVPGLFGPYGTQPAPGYAP